MAANSIVANLLKINAIKLRPEQPFTWASGWRSPIYCDNRQTLSFPEVRNGIANAFVQLIRERYPQAEVVAGVATGAIAHGMLVADRLGLPFIYVRSAAKSHGMANQVEGAYSPGQRVVVVEDLVSTGMSSLAAVDALRAAGCDVQGLVAIFTYQFPQAVKAFTEAGVAIDTLANYTELIDQAVPLGYVKAEQLELLRQWRTSPATWGR
ncbi:MAG: orotate phosphoribosyltransferase [Bacteroidales bacterium]|nr:orotate phosphoribosyltransferase [Bacteroidales bacterium]